MKYIVFILLFALQSSAEDLVCEQGGTEFLTITGLSTALANHRVGLQFKADKNTVIAANVTSLKSQEFFDWKGRGLEILRQITPSIHLYLTTDFKLELQQKVGGHCANLGCSQTAVFYSGDQLKTLHCQPSGFVEPIPPSQLKDECYGECGRSCLEKPIFCGKW